MFFSTFNLKINGKNEEKQYTPKNLSVFINSKMLNLSSFYGLVKFPSNPIQSIN